MKIQGINLNLFKTNSLNTEKQLNPFASNSINKPFAGGLSSDVFQNNSINNNQQNIFAQKAAELLTAWNKGVENFKNGAKEFCAPAISFAGRIKTGYSKLNSIKLEDIYAGIKNEISMLSLDKDVRKYMKMPVSDLKTELVKELAA